MPIGSQIAITPVLNKFTEIQPTRILDVGVGTGTFGLLFREYTDIAREKYQRGEWEVTIDGIDIWSKYITPSHRHWYNRIYIGNALDIDFGHYDFIYLGDIVEHFTKEDGLKLIEKCKEHADHIVLTTPHIFCNPEHDPLGNVNEHHLSFWTLEDFNNWEILVKEPIVAYWNKNEIN